MLSPPKKMILVSILGSMDLLPMSLLMLTRTFCFVTVTAFILVSILVSLDSLLMPLLLRMVWRSLAQQSHSCSAIADASLLCGFCSHLCTSPTWPGTGCNLVGSWSPGLVLLAFAILGRFADPQSSAHWPPLHCRSCLFPLCLCSTFTWRSRPFCITSVLVLQTAKWMAANFCASVAVVVSLLSGLLYLHRPAIVLEYFHHAVILGKARGVSCVRLLSNQGPDRSGSCLTLIRQQPDRSGCHLILIWLVLDRSGSCLILIRQQPD